MSCDGAVPSQVRASQSDGEREVEKQTPRRSLVLSLSMCSPTRPPFQLDSSARKEEHPTLFKERDEVFLWVRRVWCHATDMAPSYFDRLKYQKAETRLDAPPRGYQYSMTGALQVTYDTTPPLSFSFLPLPNQSFCGIIIAVANRRDVSLKVCGVCPCIN